MITRTRGFEVMSDRYKWDFGPGFGDEEGWEQYDTEQDAWYYGVWVNHDKKKTFEYCEGDTTLVECETENEYLEELQTMHAFHGTPPPAFKIFDQDGTITHVYDEKAAHGRPLPTG